MPWQTNRIFVMFLYPFIKLQTTDFFGFSDIVKLFPIVEKAVYDFLIVPYSVCLSYPKFRTESLRSIIRPKGMSTGFLLTAAVRAEPSLLCGKYKREHKEKGALQIILLQSALL